MKHKNIIFIGALILSVCCSCDHASNNSIDKRDKLCFPNKEDQSLFLTALKNLEIKFKHEDKEGCFYFDSKYRVEVNNLQMEIFGKPPPAGLSISQGKLRNAELVEKLGKNGIKTRYVVYHGKEFVAWEEKDADRVERLINIAPEQLEHMHKIRESLNSPNGN